MHACGGTHTSRRTSSAATASAAPAEPNAAPSCAPPRVDLPISLYSAPDARMQALAEAGFALAGPFYPLELLPSRLDAARAAGLGIVYPIGYPHRRFVDERHIVWSAEETYAALTEQLATLADDPSIAAWYLYPEELRPAVAADLAYLEAATAAIRAADPRSRPILNYQPNGRTREQLVPIVRALDGVAIGVYANYARHRDKRAFVRWGVEELVAAIETSGRAVVPFAVLEMFAEPPAADPTRIERWVRHDAHAALLAGARGLLVFSGWARPRFPAYEAYLGAYLQVVRELVGTVPLAGPVLHGEEVTTPWRAVIGGGRVFVDVRPQRVDYPSVQVRTFTWKGCAWTYVVNSAATRAVVEIDVPTAEPLLAREGWDAARRWLALPPHGVGVLQHAR